MNNPRKLIALTVGVLFLSSFTISCSRDADTGSKPRPDASSVADDDDKKACDAPISDPDINQTRAKMVEKRLKHWIDKDEQLRTRIQVEVYPVNNYFLEVYASGQARGDDELEDFYQIVRKFMHKDDKKGCVRKVKFVPPGEGEMRTRDVAFEWSSCKYPPDIVCPDGACHPEPCPGLTGNSNANANANGTSNTNTNNSNANTNIANSNSGSNVNLGTGYR